MEKDYDGNKASIGSTVPDKTTTGLAGAGAGAAGLGAAGAGAAALGGDSKQGKTADSSEAKELEDPTGLSKGDKAMGESAPYG